MTPPPPLHGMTVIEVGAFVQGPLAAQLLGNLGATVIKVERPNRGDPSRGLRTLYGAGMFTEDGRAMLWELCNRDKQSICLDLQRPEGREVLHELVRSADVFVTNVQRETLEVFECTSDELFELNPRLIYGLGGGLTVYGERANDPAQDTVAMAQGGFMATAGLPDGTPSYPPGALADVTAGTSIAAGVVAALLRRHLHNAERQLVTTSLVQAIAWTQMLGVGVPANTGNRFQPFERGKTANPVMSIYQAADGRWISLGILALTDAIWRDLCGALETTHWNETTDWGDSWQNRLRSAQEIYAAIQERLLQRPADEWLARLRASGIPCAPVNHPEDLLRDQGMLADGVITQGADGLRFVSGPFGLEGIDPAASTPAPELGQDTASVLARAGYSDEQIATLLGSGAAW